MTGVIARGSAALVAAVAVVACASSSSVTPQANRAPEVTICTLRGCFEGLTLELSTSSEWQAGRYEVDVDSELGRIACVVELPLAERDGVGRIERCTPPQGPMRGLSVWAGHAQGQPSGLERLNLGALPVRATVSVSRDGVKLVEREFHPTYQLNFPNGPRCGGACRQAGESLVVP